MNGNLIESLLTIILLVLTATMLSIADHRIFRTWLTPFVLLAVPYTSVALLAFSIGPVLGFVPLYAPSVVIWIAALMAFWVGGMAAALPLRRSPARMISRLHTSLRYETQSRKLVMLISWGCILILGMSAARLAMAGGGFAVLGTDAFTSTYGSGLTGHLFTVAQLMLVYWIGTLRRSRVIDLVTTATLIAVNLLYQGKGALMVPVLGGIIFRLMLARLQLSWRTGLLIGVTGYVLFNLVYLVTFSTADLDSLFSPGAYRDLFYHFWTFLFAGVLGFSELVRQGVEIGAPPSYLVEPFLNILALLLRRPFFTGGVSGFEYVLIHPAYDKVTNVLTMFGVMQAALGSLGALLAAALMGAGYYALFIVALRTRNCWFIAAYSFLGAVLCFGWFSYFYSLLTYLEIPLICAFFALAVALADKLWPQAPGMSCSAGFVERTEPAGKEVY